MAKLPTDLYDFNLVSTPDPEEFTIAVTVASDEVNKNLRLLNGKLEVGTPYKRLCWSPAFKRVEEFGDYGYTYATTGNATTTFFFARKHSAEEKNTPFKQWDSTQNYPWPSVLEDLYFVRDPNFSQASYDGTTTQTAPTILPRYVFRPGVTVDCRIQIKQFLSDTPWSSSTVTHPQPIPTAINGSYIGVSVDFPKCLHPRIIFPEFLQNPQIVLNAGVVNPTRTRAPEQQIFPATNFGDWRPFVISDTVQPTNGLYLREMVKIFPPIRGESITQ